MRPMPAAVRPRLAAVAGMLAISAGIAGCGSASTSSPTPSASAASTESGMVTMDIKDFTFHPGSLTVRVGSAVLWRNGDASAHTATSDAKYWDTGTISPGDSSRVITFSTPGTFSYHCAIHQYMTATITVAG